MGKVAEFRARNWPLAIGHFRKACLAAFRRKASESDVAFCSFAPTESSWELLVRRFTYIGPDGALRQDGQKLLTR